MSYLSRRMREEGFWTRRKPSDLVFTIEVDVRQARRAFRRVSRAVDDIADLMRQHLDVELDPWQEHWLEAAFADPDALRRMTVPPVAGRRWPPVLVATTPGEPSSLAHLVAKVREAGQGTSPTWEWPDEALEYQPRQTGKSTRSNREYLGVWPTSRERE